MKHQVLIVGGGSAGLTVAAHLSNSPNPPEIAIIEPSSKHYYQPLWTLIGAGVFPREESERNQADFIPPGATWIQEKVASFDPGNNKVKLENGDEVEYEYLVVAAGIQIDWDKIPGLSESIGKPETGVCSNYSYNTVQSTWQNIQNLKKGRAIFTQPSTPIKCGGAPQKICYLATHHFEKAGVRNNIDVVFASAKGGIFPVAKYAASLNQVVERRKINTRFEHELIALRPDSKEAVFTHIPTGDEVVMEYDMIHVTPPMSAPDFIKSSPLAGDEGWVSVDPGTLQHTKFDNVFALGDCSNLPTSKTGAAIRKQAPVVAHNLESIIAGRTPAETYDGYTSCPLVTGYGSLILAEFDYAKEPLETFAFNQAQERYSMYALKAYGLPRLYWHGMLRGRA